MKSLLSLGLGAAVLLSAWPGQVAAADAPLAVPTVPPHVGAAQPAETVALRAARHALEERAVVVQFNALIREFPLLTGPGWEENFGQFQAEIKRLQGLRESNRRPVMRLSAGGPSRLPVAAPFAPGSQLADLPLMRRWADQIGEKYPKLRDYADQQFRWHQRMYELAGQYADNPQVRQRVLDRLAGVPQPVAPEPAPGQP